MHNGPRPKACTRSPQVTHADQVHAPICTREISQAPQPTWWTRASGSVCELSRHGLGFGAGRNAPIAVTLRDWTVRRSRTCPDGVSTGWQG